MAKKKKTKKALKKASSRATQKECFFCKKKLPLKDFKAHDCWSTTESALTQDLPVEMQDAWERLREVATDFGEQRIYASHRSIMFSRKSCYFFVRPLKKRLELCFFAGRKIKHPSIRKTYATTKTKIAHQVHVTHRDQVEAPLTDWLKEAYEFCPPQKTEGTQSQALVVPKRKTITFEDLVAR